MCNERDQQESKGNRRRKLRGKRRIEELIIEQVHIMDGRGGNAEASRV